MISTFNDKIVEPTNAQTINHLDDVFSKGPVASGFKFKFSIQFEKFPEIVERLEKLGNDLRVVVLERSNYIKQAISLVHIDRLKDNQTPMRGGNLTASSNRSLIHVDVVDVRRLVFNIQEQTLGMREFSERFENVIRIDYSDLNLNTESVVNEVIGFLGVDQSAEVKSPFRKATPERLEEVIANYEELKEVFANTPFAHFFQNDGNTN